MPTVLASCNVRFTLPPNLAEAAIRKVLADRPHLLALQEVGRDRDRILQKITTGQPLDWTRPDSPNGDPVMPAIWHTHRYRLRSTSAVRLARREYVGHLPGRKSRLPASWATELILDGLAPDDVTPNDRHTDGTVTVLLNFHLTAEIQHGAGYRKDAAHRLRVARHKREKRRLARRARTHLKRGRTVYCVGDGNFDGLTMPGLVSCWQGRKGGTLGDRAVDVVLAERKAAKVWTLETASDHDALIALYP